MNGRPVGDRILYVAIAQPKGERQAMLQRARAMSMAGRQLPPTTMPSFPPLGGFPPVAAYPPLTPMMSLAQYPWPSGSGHQGGLMPMNSGTFHHAAAHALQTGFAMHSPKAAKRNTRKDSARRAANKHTAPLPQWSTSSLGVAGGSDLNTSAGGWEGDKDKVVLGHRLYPLVYGLQGDEALAQKITGMLLGESNMEVEKMINDGQTLKDGVDEAVKMLKCWGLVSNAGVFSKP
eukprot:evm.model.scf_280EXC.1 EVM.evm.TU.scf_280EXC.1   scf_280EXC:17-4059(+)